MMKTDQFAPVALFVYNRPSHTRVLLDSLTANKESKNTDLFIFSDAAKNSSQSELVDDVRNIISDVKGFKSINIIEQEKNLGLAKSVISGVTQLCNDYGRVIVLEDDLVLSLYFLNYMNAALERYKDEELVMQVSGHMFPVSLDIVEDTVFLPFISTWGWATWKRAWDKFDPEMKGYSQLKGNKILRKRFDLDGAYPYFKMLEKQRRGKVDSWGIRWNLSVFENSGLVLYPVVSLVENAGFDGSGTHCLHRIDRVSGSVLKGVNIDGFAGVAVGIDEGACSMIKKYLKSKNRLSTKLIARVLAMFQ